MPTHPDLNKATRDALELVDMARKLARDRLAAGELPEAGRFGEETAVEGAAMQTLVQALAIGIVEVALPSVLLDDGIARAQVLRGFQIAFDQLEQLALPTLLLHVRGEIR